MLSVGPDAFRLLPSQDLYINKARYGNIDYRSSILIQIASAEIWVEQQRNPVMGRHQDKNGRQLALSFVKDSEARVLQQKQLIARLKHKRQSTEYAEAMLNEFEANLRSLRNHLELMQELMKPPER